MVRRDHDHVEQVTVAVVTADLEKYIDLGVEDRRGVVFDI